MINVTKSFLPPLNEYVESLKRIWDTHHLTNRGELVLSLENQLEKMFDLKHCLVVANATLGIQLVIKSLNLKGQIITTQFISPKCLKAAGRPPSPTCPVI